jgi:hypothetical protein
VGVAAASLALFAPAAAQAQGDGTAGIEAAPNPAVSYVAPSNIAFSGVQNSTAAVADAYSRNTFNDDAYDGYGDLRLGPTGGSGSVGFGPDACDLNDTTQIVLNDSYTSSHAAYSANPAILTCVAPGVSYGGDTFTITVVRTFQGSWARWAVSAVRTAGTSLATLPLQFYANLGSDSNTVFYPAPPSGTTSSWVSDQGSSPSDPVLFNAVSGNSYSIEPASQGNGSFSIDFNAAIDGSTSLVVSNALLEFPIFVDNVYDVTDLPLDTQLANQATARACALTLSVADFGSTLLAGSCAGGGSEDGTPPPVLQQVGRPSTGTCNAISDESLDWGGATSGGWATSWAEWPNEGKGGAVCTRTLNYSNGLGHWWVVG